MVFLYLLKENNNNTAVIFLSIRILIHIQTSIKVLSMQMLFPFPVANEANIVQVKTYNKTKVKKQKITNISINENKTER